MDCPAYNLVTVLTVIYHLHGVPKLNLVKICAVKKSVEISWDLYQMTKKPSQIAQSLPNCLLVIFNYGFNTVFWRWFIVGRQSARTFLMFLDYHTVSSSNACVSVFVYVTTLRYLCLAWYLKWFTICCINVTVSVVEFFTRMLSVYSTECVLFYLTAVRIFHIS